MEELKGSIAKVKSNNGNGRPTRRRKMGPLIISLTILLALSALYFFLYMEGEGQKFDQRRFRVLSRVAENIHKKEEGFQKLIIEIKRELAANTSQKTLDEILKAKNKEYQHAGLTLSRVKNNLDSYYRYPRKGVEIIQEKEEGSDSDTSLVYVYYELKSYLKDVIPETTFEHFIFLKDDAEQDKSNSADPFIREVIYQDLDNNVLTYKDKNSSVDSLLVKSNGLYSGNISSVELAGNRYRLYVHVENNQRENLPLDESSYLNLEEERLIFCGLVSEGEYSRYKRRVNIWLIVFLSILLLLVVVSLPLIKTHFISDIEGLQASDAILSGVSIIVGVPFVVLALLSLWAYSDYYSGKQQEKLQKLASTIDNRAHGEVKSLLTDLRSPGLYATLTSEESNYQKARNLGFPLDSGGRIFSSKGFNEYFGVKDDGMQLFSFTTYKANQKLLIPLADREYFRRISGLSGKPWSFNFNLRTDNELEAQPSNEQIYYMQSVTSWTTGDHEAVVIIRNPHEKAFSDDTTMAKYLAMSSKLNSLIDPVIPAGFGYAVLDSEGNTLFHSNENRIQSENFLDETNGDDYLKSALFGNRDEFLETSYWGERIRAHVRPSRNFPFYIVTYQKQDHIRVFIAEVVSVGIVLVVLSFVMLSLVVYITSLLDRPTHRKMVSVKPFSFDWLRPNLEKGPHYKLSMLVMIVYAVIYIIFIVVCEQLDFWKGTPNLIVLGLFLPMICFITNYWLSKFSEDDSPMRKKYEVMGVLPMGLTRGLIGVFVFSNAAHYLLWTLLKDANWTSGGIIFLIVVLTYVLMLANYGRKIKKVSGEYEDSFQQKLWTNGLLVTVHFVFLETYNFVFSSLLELPFYLWVNVLWIGALIYMYTRIIKPFYIDELKSLESSNAEKDRAKWRGQPKNLRKRVPNEDRFKWLGKPGRADQSAVLHYSRFLLLWVVIATVLPTFVNFCKVYSVETRIYSRYEQLKAAKEIEKKIYETSLEFSTISDPDFLKHKAYNTSYLGALNLNTSLQKAKVLNHKYFNERFKGVLYNLRPNYHNTIIENKTALFEYSADHNWHWPEGSTDMLFYTLDPSREYLGEKNLLQVASDSDYGLFGTSSSPRTVIYLVLMAGFLFYLYRLIKSVYKSMFGTRWIHYALNENNRIDLSDIESQITDPESSKSLLIFPGEYFKQIFSERLSSRCTLKHTVIDLENVIDDLDELERLVKRKNVILLANHYPYQLYERLESNEKLLRNLKSMIYGCKQMIVNQTLFENNLSKTDWIRKNTWLKDEIDSSQFVAELVRQGDVFRENDLTKLKRNEVILKVQQAAYNHYTDIWESLAESEKYILYDLAEDGIVNTKNAQSVISLFEKGLIQWKGRLRIMNRSFANYILTAVRREEGDKIEKERTVKGSWTGIRTILYLLIAAVFVFIALGEPDFFADFNTLITVIASIITLFPVIGSLFSSSSTEN